MNPTHHIPVLLEQVLMLLQPQAGESYLDLTAGYGGHAQKILELTRQPAESVLVDRDQKAIETLMQQFPKAHLIHSDYYKAAKQLQAQDRQFEMILMDLGLSSPQLDNTHRGFSIRTSGPLDMRMDVRQSLTAAEIVNSYSETELANLIYRYGEERKSRQIARSIVAARPLSTTEELARVVARNFRSYSKVHPATRTFQALRIAVNEELTQLEQTLELLPNLLANGGRVAIISFHSLEDRLVKKFLRSHSRPSDTKPQPPLQLLTKKVVMGKTYDVSNPRARSSRLRAAIKIKTV